MNQHPTQPIATRAPAACALVATLAALGCGGGEDPRVGEVMRAVQDFASADGEEACELLTEAALERIYGGLEGCLERADRFEKGAVKVESVTLSERGTRATAQARSLSGKNRFTVVARLVAPAGCPDPCPTAQWRISDVKPR